LDDGNGSRITIVENNTSKFRIVAQTTSGEYVINAWVRPDRPLKKISELFFAFPAIVNRTNVQFGFGFGSKEEADCFNTIFQNCVMVLQKSKPKELEVPQ